MYNSSTAKRRLGSCATGENTTRVLLTYVCFPFLTVTGRSRRPLNRADRAFVIGSFVYFYVRTKTLDNLVLLLCAMHFTGPQEA